MPIFMLVLHYLDYRSFVKSLTIKKCEASTFLLLSQVDFFFFLTLLYPL